MFSKAYLVELASILFVLVLGICNGQSIKVTTNEFEHFKEGDEAKLMCKFEPAQAIVDITWSRRTNGEEATVVLRNNVLDSYKDRFSLDLKYGNGDLIINSVKREDSGRYICRVYSQQIIDHGDGFTELDVQWLSDPQLSLLPDEKREYGFEQGDNATFLCKNNGNPTPEITWYKENDTLENSADMERYDVNGTLGHLKISNITLDDHAVFKCATTNDVGTTFRDVPLNIRHKPIVELVFDGKNQVECQASSFPLPYIYTFLVDHKPQTGKGNVLVIQIDGPSAFVNVSCEATNVDGKGSDEREIYIKGKPVAEPVQKLEGGAIAGIVIGCVAGLCLLLFALIYVLKKSKSPAKSSTPPKKTGGNAIYKPVTGDVKSADETETVEIQSGEASNSADNKPWV